jgi:hypothetical protein
MKILLLILKALINRKINLKVKSKRNKKTYPLKKAIILIYLHKEISKKTF